MEIWEDGSLKKGNLIEKADKFSHFPKHSFPHNFKSRHMGGWCNFILLFCHLPFFPRVRIDVLVENILWTVSTVANFNFKAQNGTYTAFLLHKLVWSRHVSSRSMWSWPCTQIKTFCHIVQVVLFPWQTYRELTIARQVLFQIPLRTLPLTGDKTALMLGVFTAPWTGMTGFVFFCKIIPASCNPSSFLHRIFLKVFFSLDPEHRKLFQDLHC